MGSSIDLLVDRDGKKLKLRIGIEDRSVVWAQQEADNHWHVPEPPKPVLPTEVKFGITISNLRAKERQDLGIDGKSGVRVVSVDPGSFADDIGLRENDAIIAINRQPVSSPDDVLNFAEDVEARSAGGGARGPRRGSERAPQFPEPAVPFGKTAGGLKRHIRPIGIRGSAPSRAGQSTSG